MKHLGMQTIQIWRRQVRALPGALFAMIALTASAQTVESPAVAPPPESYAPEIGEMMTFQQMRHAKLWYAGQAKNWALADFETHELREGFGAIAKYYPTLNDVPIAQMLSSIEASTFVELDLAVAARDASQFGRAFDGLTQACNACHQASGIGFVVIQRPSAPPFSNQSFSAHE